MSGHILDSCGCRWQIKGVYNTFNERGIVPIKRGREDAMSVLATTSLSRKDKRDGTERVKA